ncbi:hypothetical protein MYAM1_004099 [Malassezia yamatoensis]|uniref:Ricin B lectin domain-containing protein n=1 Tax=Malassezia yamatoensis TaxID=253288 RepID=A0AAJ6CL29_9BASI|nr:hypothetical protein MYAM1_004099 [Malassezia yamatoensis]
MFVIPFLFLLLIASAASAHGSPVEQRSAVCKPVGEATKLVSHSVRDGSTGYFETVKKNQGLNLVRANSTTEQFQFYECTPPSINYRKSDYRAKYGQLQSTKHKGKCVTAGNYWIQRTGCLGGDGTFEKFPSDDGTITLQPCAKQDTELMRRQWLAYATISFKESCNTKSVLQASYRGDTDLEALIGDSEKSHFSYIDGTNKHTHRPQGFMSNTFPKGC